MAKKSVASLQTGSKRLTKAIKMVKSPKTGAYMFVESVMAPEFVNDFSHLVPRFEGQAEEGDSETGAEAANEHDNGENERIEHVEEG